MVILLVRKSICIQVINVFVSYFSYFSILLYYFVAIAILIELS